MKIKLAPDDHVYSPPLVRTLARLGYVRKVFTTEDIDYTYYTAKSVLKTLTQLVERGYVEKVLGGFSITDLGLEVLGVDLFIQGEISKIMVGKLSKTSHWAIKALCFLPNPFMPSDMADFASETDFEPAFFTQQLRYAGLVIQRGLEDHLTALGCSVRESALEG